MIVVTRNFRCRAGEIDLIMRQGETLIFVEVRRRRGSRFGRAADSVDAAKRHKLTRSASYFLAKHRRYANAPVRFDVVGIDGAAERIEWIRDAFRPGED